MKFYLFVLFAISIIGCKDNDTAIIQTEFGDMTVHLFDSTPKHKANFNKLVSEKYFDGLLFHRVMNGFMIQGGDPDSRDADMKAPLGMGGPGYTIPAEIAIPHFKGMLAAARQGDAINPNKESSGSQFYIVHGRPVSDSELDMMEHSKGFKYSDAQRAKYKKLGGTPMLDGDYTVFGEVISGLDVIDKIASVEVLPTERPAIDVKMKIKHP
ncbi:MAG: peptidylprolyl isomerase [Saprospiraceae bacterium]